jgi:hypothetical protein
MEEKGQAKETLSFLFSFSFVFITFLKLTSLIKSCCHGWYTVSLDRMKNLLPLFRSPVPLLLELMRPPQAVTPLQD